MRTGFANTTNVQAFERAMGRLLKRPAGVPGMALVYGDPGLGKTRTALWWCAKNDGVFLRTKKLMTGRWLLEELVSELGEAPMWRTSDLFRQCMDQLLNRPRPVFIDEADYLTRDSRVLETLRDLHDMTEASIILIGMDQADKKLRRYRHLYDRFSEVVRFHELTERDIHLIASQLCEVQLSEEVVRYVYQKTNRFRGIIRHLHRIETMARRNNLRKVTMEDIKGGSDDE
jgi:DNA transposition AAA+ family ATPase